MQRVLTRLGKNYNKGLSHRIREGTTVERIGVQAKEMGDQSLTVIPIPLTSQPIKSRCLTGGQRLDGQFHLLRRERGIKLR
ncbi:hypothetical protein GDO81_021574 [Engystomops pustulosus]|uniref:Uncharacterized protein n=1 Tax=Engystomops pustulosus TaxID=76066 RepID=A0AAV6YQU3_ENGPU|nr:hypothetical protein GDO81_021574 [Engystomops pustulosus]